MIDFLLKILPLYQACKNKWKGSLAFNIVLRTIPNTSPQLLKITFEIRNISCKSIPIQVTKLEQNPNKVFTPTFFYSEDKKWFQKKSELDDYLIMTVEPSQQDIVALKENEVFNPFIILDDSNTVEVFRLAEKPNPTIPKNFAILSAGFPNFSSQKIPAADFFKPGKRFYIKSASNKKLYIPHKNIKKFIERVSNL